MWLTSANEPLAAPSHGHVAPWQAHCLYRIKCGAVPPAPCSVGRPRAPAHLYLRCVEGGLSWVYCDRDTRFALVDALALL